MYIHHSCCCWFCFMTKRLNGEEAWEYIEKRQQIYVGGRRWKGNIRVGQRECKTGTVMCEVGYGSCYLRLILHHLVYLAYRYTLFITIQKRNVEMLMILFQIEIILCQPFDPVKSNKRDWKKVYILKIHYMIHII